MKAILSAASFEGIARGVPAGWGEPVFDKLEADLAKAMLSLPASKAFEIGSGFGGILLTGREHNDAFRVRSGKVFTTTNRSGGIQGGISNGGTIFFRTAFKPSPPSCTNRTRWMSLFTTRRSLAGAVTIHVYCRAPCRWLRR